MSERLQLFSFGRSSAAYRVRIGLNLKQRHYELCSIQLSGEELGLQQREYARLNPQRLVPTLVHGDRVLRQSLAILEYLEDIYPQPALLPNNAHGRARVRALAQVITADIHPLNSQRVRKFLTDEWHISPSARNDWAKHWMREGFRAIEALLASDSETGTYCHGEKPGIADCCLIPQVHTARRFDLDLTPYPTILRIEQACLSLFEFSRASPEQQPDASQASSA